MFLRALKRRGFPNYHYSFYDCLKQTWHGNVFMNPPFSDPTPFLEKVLSAYQGGEIDAAITLTLSACSQNTDRRFLDQSDAWCKWRSRINYVDARSGKLIKGINQGSSLHYFGRERDRFRSIFLSVEGNQVYFHDRPD